MKLKNETAKSEELKKKIEEIKARLKAELDELIQQEQNKLMKLKKEDKQTEQEQTKELKRQRVNALAHNFYNNNYKNPNKQSLKDQYSNELFGKPYKECNVLEQKVVNNRYFKEYRKRQKEENKRAKEDVQN